MDADLATGNIKAGAILFGVAGKTEVVDTTSGDAVAGEMLSGKKAWVDGVEVTGSIATQTLANTSTTVSGGFYAGTDLVTVDADLATGNIKAGAILFGVAGKTEVVDTTSGDAVAGEMLSGKKAWVDGSEVTGNAPAAAIMKTGQITSYSATGGEDGDLQKGVTWPNPRFTDNSNGTVTDNLTKLIWLKNANAFSTRTWEQALADANALANGSSGLTDGSIAGNWRLPNRFELESLVDLVYFNPALSNALGTGQWASGDAFSGVQSSYYWSSTTYSGNSAFAWVVYLSAGGAFDGSKTSTYYVWPVRAGQ